MVFSYVKKHREIIDSYAEKGFRYVGFVPTEVGANGCISFVNHFFGIFLCGGYFAIFRCENNNECHGQYKQDGCYAQQDISCWITASILITNYGKACCNRI